MPDVGTDNKYLSELIAGPVPFVSSDHANFYTARVDIYANGADLDLDPVGTPLVYDAAAGGGNFVPYIAQDISLVTTSSLPDESPVCLLIGPATGAGSASSNITVTDGSSLEVTVLFRGPIAVNQDGMDLTGIAAGDVTEFVAQLEKQAVRVLPVTTTVAPQHVDNS